MGAFSEFDLDRQAGGVIDPFADQPFDSSCFPEEEDLFSQGQEPVGMEPLQPETGNQSAPAAAIVDTQLLSNPVPDEQAADEEKAKELAAEEAEAKKRAEHEAAEAERKRKWEERVQAKKHAEQAFVDRVAGMSEEEMLEEAVKRTSRDTERVLGRNLKECVTEHIQMKCYEDLAFLRLTLQPRKTMIRCFQYINRKAFEHIQDEMKANGFQPSRENPVYAADVPDSLCYQWAEDYFRDPTVQEDQEKEEEFIPKPYPGKTNTAKKPAAKKTEKKKTEKKPAPKKAEPAKKEPKADEDQFSFDSIMNAAETGAA